jgi:hypothetical protein
MVPNDPSLLRRSIEIPVGSALTTLAPGLAALATHTVLLFPSLGPTALMQAHARDHKTARPYNVIVGHALGLASGFLFVGLFGLKDSPSVFELHAVSAARVSASIAALALAALFEVLLDAAHPPAASTTLLASLGSFKPTWSQTAQVAFGVLIVAVIAEGVRRYRSGEMRTLTTSG